MTICIALACEIVNLPNPHANDDVPEPLLPAAIAFPILSKHWPRFHEEFAASVVKNAPHLQRAPALCANIMIKNQGAES